jgi:hypothetical protein
MNVIDDLEVLHYDEDFNGKLWESSLKLHSLMMLKLFVKLALTLFSIRQTNKISNYLMEIKGNSYKA